MFPADARVIRLFCPKTGIPRPGRQNYRIGKFSLGPRVTVKNKMSESDKNDHNDRSDAA